MNTRLWEITLKNLASSRGIIIGLFVHEVEGVSVIFVFALFCVFFLFPLSRIRGNEFED